MPNENKEKGKAKGVVWGIVLGILCIIFGVSLGGNIGNFIFCIGLGCFVIYVFLGVYHLIKKVI